MNVLAYGGHSTSTGLAISAALLGLLSDHRFVNRYMFYGDELYKKF